VSLKTSGTTGPAKRIEISYANLSASIAAVQAHHGGDSQSEVALRPGVTIQMLALAHTSALQSLCVTVANGRQLVLLEKFEPVAWVRAQLEAYKVPTVIATTDAIPRNIAMKPDRRAILDLLGFSAEIDERGGGHRHQEAEVSHPG